MSLRMRPQSTARHGLWVAGLLIILGGLFGMHGLDNHGGAGMGSVADASMPGPAADVAVAGHGAVTGTVHAAAAVVVAVADMSGRADMGMGAAGMCMAVLVLTLIALIAWVHASRVRPLLWLVARHARAPEFRGRDPDPPSLIRLSIQRC